MKYLNLIRVKHWIKNLLIFIPIISSGILSCNQSIIIKSILGFFAFSFLTSSIYIINDIRDIEKDKLSETKKNRPLASGIISKKAAILIAILLIILSIMINFLINHYVINIPLIFLLSYFIINIAYSFGLKNVPIFDVLILATGFVLRVYYGASLFKIKVSSWLFLTILSASLFLGFGKRRKELEKNKNVRKVLDNYSENFLDKFQYLSLTLMLVFYSLWTIEQNSNYLVFTVPLVMIIFMEYSLITEKSGEGDPITIIYENKILMFLCLIYGLVMFTLLVL